MSKEQKRQEILDAFQFRHATKEFDPNKKISEEDFQFILETGRLSPSSFGLEPWKFVVIQNHELRKKIKDASWGAAGKLPEASHYIAILARTEKDMRFDSDYIENHLRNVKKAPEEIVERMVSTIKNFQESEFDLLNNDRAMFDWSCRQAYIALANMMTAAAQIGIDSCPIEGFDMQTMDKIFAEEALLEDGRLRLAVMCAFGYRANEPRPKTRKAMKEIVEWR